MKSTLKRESKALEIVEIDTFVVSGCFVFGFSWFSSFVKMLGQSGNSQLGTAG